MTNTATKAQESAPTPGTTKPVARVRLSSYDRPRVPAARPGYDAAAVGRLPSATRSSSPFAYTGSTAGAARNAQELACETRPTA